MPARQIEHSVITHVPQRVAWDWWTNVNNWREHEGDRVESIMLEGPFETGTRAVTKERGQPPRPWRLAEVRAPERAVIEMDLPDAVLRFAWTFEDLKNGSTRLTQAVNLDGPAAERYAADLDTYSRSLGPGMEKIALRMAEQKGQE